MFLTFLIKEERNRADQIIHDIDTKLDEYKDQLDATEVQQLKDDAAEVSEIFLQIWISKIYKWNYFFMINKILDFEDLQQKLLC